MLYELKCLFAMTKLTYNPVKTTNQARRIGFECLFVGVGVLVWLACFATIERDRNLSSSTLEWRMRARNYLLCKRRVRHLGSLSVWMFNSPLMFMSKTNVSSISRQTTYICIALEWWLLWSNEISIMQMKCIQCASPRLLLLCDFSPVASSGKPAPREESSEMKESSMVQRCTLTRITNLLP